MTQTSDTANRVINHMQEFLGIEKITGDAKLYEDLDADSLDCLEIGMGLEEEFSIELSDEETDNIKTVQDFISLVESKL